jgi:hypothetical protein
MSTQKKPSRRAAQRLAAELSKAPLPLTGPLQKILDGYVPCKIAEPTWLVISAMHADVMQRSGIAGVQRFRSHVGVVASYLAWRHDQSMSIEIVDAFTADQINRYYLHGLSGSALTRNDYRSRLNNVAVAVNTSGGAPVRIPTLGHRSVQPGYTTAEEHQIRHVASRQRSESTRRQLCVIVGLCGGAGLGPGDLRELRGSDVIDHGGDGMKVVVGGKNPRTVWVRVEYEEILRLGLLDVAAKQLLVGESKDRRNVTTGVLARAEMYDCPHIDAGRLRSTWLTWLLTRSVPIKLILDAAGLKSARTITELAGQLPPSDVPVADLRGNAEPS